MLGMEGSPGMTPGPQLCNARNAHTHESTAHTRTSAPGHKSTETTAQAHQGVDIQDGKRDPITGFPFCGSGDRCVDVKAEGLRYEEPLPHLRGEEMFSVLAALKHTVLSEEAKIKHRASRHTPPTAPVRATGVAPEVMGYRADIEAGIYDGNPALELQTIGALMDIGDLGRNEYRWLYNRRARMEHRVRSVRNKVMAARGVNGRLPGPAQEEVNFRSTIAGVQKILNGDEVDK